MADDKQKYLAEIAELVAEGKVDGKLSLPGSPAVAPLPPKDRPRSILQRGSTQDRQGNRGH